MKYSAVWRIGRLGSFEKPGLHACRPTVDGTVRAKDLTQDSNLKAKHNNSIACSALHLRQQFFTMSDDQVKRRQTESQVEAIETKIRETQPLTSQKQEISTLRSNYEEGSNFDKGVLHLTESYTAIRTVRGDGNCYYRAFLYSLCETTMELKRIIKVIDDSIDCVEKCGYERFTIESFWEELLDFLKSLPKDFHDELNQENAISDYASWYMRILTAVHLKSDPERFVHFLEGDYFDVPTFCQREVEPMGKECGMVQVLALAESLGVQVEIEYLDGRDTKPTKHSFGPEDTKTTLTLLYRPGHYDILYKS
jgi:ubiquitin thioesterase protein OTUB1